jgi:multiple sugar transport system substrate-binding protein
MPLLSSEPGRVFPRRRLLKLSLAGFLGGTVVGGSGCPLGSQPARRPFAGQSISVAVVNDPDLVAELGQYKNEWESATGATVSIQSTTSGALSSGDPMTADVLMYPPAELGGLVARGAIVPVPETVLDDPALAWDDVFSTLRTRIANWGGIPYAIPGGCPIAVLVYREDLFTRLNKTLPATWEEFHQLADSLSDRSGWAFFDGPNDSPWQGSIEPLAAGWAARTLLARAAAYVDHPQSYSGLFQYETLDPLIESPPFRQALDELVAANLQTPPASLEAGPADTYRAVVEGRAAMALTWTVRTPVGGPSLRPAAGAVVGFADVPGSTRMFDPSRRRWEPRMAEGGVSVPLLGADGVLGSVAAASAHSQAAFQWLVSVFGEEGSRRLPPASPHAALYRKSHLADPKSWVGSDGLGPEAASKYAALLEKAHLSPRMLRSPAIPGAEQYLAALDAAVRDVVLGQETATDALARTAARWRGLTNELGLENQKRAYQASLGLTQDA